MPSPRKAQLYGRRWRGARQAHLVRNPLCVMCKQQGRLGRATVVDHIKPHRLDPVLFWDESNWQSLCKVHHDSTKQAQEKSGKVVGVDGNGRPIDPGHPWNKTPGGSLEQIQPKRETGAQLQTLYVSCFLTEF
jgi:hypothetical protein